MSATPYREPAEMPPRDPVLDAIEALNDAVAGLRRATARVRETAEELRAGVARMDARRGAESKPADE